MSSTGSSLSPEQQQQLIRASIDAAANSHSPYSRYRVGAALLLPDGSLVLGCNVENCSYPLTCCAEKTAVVKAVSDGHRSFVALAVSAPCDENNADEFPKMCGACRQVLCEFCDDQLPVYHVRQCDAQFVCHSLGECLPGAFRPKDLL